MVCQKSCKPIKTKPEDEGQIQTLRILNLTQHYQKAPDSVLFEVRSDKTLLSYHS